MQDIARTYLQGEHNLLFLMSLISMFPVVALGSTKPARTFSTRCVDFSEASAEMGRLTEILEEAGYENKSHSWEAPDFVALERERASVQ